MPGWHYIRPVMIKTGINVFTFLILMLIFMSGCTPLVNMMSFFPERSPVNRKNLPKCCRLQFIPVNSKIQLESWFLPCTSSSTLVIYFHGNAGNIRQRLPNLNNLRNGDVNVLGFSYRGYGASTGRPSEKGIYQDGEAVLQFALDSLMFKTENIVLMGRSIGSTAALHTARGRNLAGVILVTPLSSGKDHARIHGFGFLTLLSGNCFDNMSKVKELKAPLLVIHGTDDEIIPINHGKKLYHAAQTRKRFVTIKSGSHDNLELVEPKKYWGEITSFLQSPILLRSDRR